MDLDANFWFSRVWVDVAYLYSKGFAFVLFFRCERFEKTNQKVGKLLERMCWNLLQRETFALYDKISCVKFDFSLLEEEKNVRSKYETDLSFVPFKDSIQIV